MIPATGGAHYLRAAVASRHRNHSPGLRQHETGPFVAPDTVGRVDRRQRMLDDSRVRSDGREVGGGARPD